MLLLLLPLSLVFRFFEWEILEIVVEYFPRLKGDNFMFLLFFLFFFFVTNSNYKLHPNNEGLTHLSVTVLRLKYIFKAIAVVDSFECLKQVFEMVFSWWFIQKVTSFYILQFEVFRNCKDFSHQFIKEWQFEEIYGK